ncbi:RES family NAD+ phosphorylase [Arthrobacter bambusae]
MSPKNPREPRSPLTARPEDFKKFSEPLFTVYPTSGPYRRAWSATREFGPVQSCRWDPHPEPRGYHPGVSVLYAATDPTTAFAEVFQSRRSITVSGRKALAGWAPARELRLLDLMSDLMNGSWALRNGASASLDSAPKSTCRAWARAIADTWKDLDGLYVRSTVTGVPMAVLFAPAADSYPANPSFTRPLDHPVLAPLITKAADDLGGWPIRTA